MIPTFYCERCGKKAPGNAHCQIKVFMPNAYDNMAWLLHQSRTWCRDCQHKFANEVTTHFIRFSINMDYHSPTEGDTANAESMGICPGLD